MKAMSKLFLIIAGILVVLGAILMIIGAIMAKKQGVQLFQEKIDGKYVYTLDLSDKEVAKISIDATDTDINVYTGEENEYIEFINFNQNYYSVSTTNKVVKFDENISLKSIFSFWDGNFSFKGLRSILNLGKSADGQKEVNIHLKDTSDINVFNFSITDGDITVKNADSTTDYLITLSSGNVTLENVKTESKVMVNGNNCTLNIRDCRIKYFASDVANVDMTASVDGVKSFEFTGKTGNVTASVGLLSSKSDVKISSNLAFTYNSEEHSGNFSNIDKNTQVTDEFAIVHINGDGVKIAADVRVPATDAETAEETKGEEK